MLRPRAALAAGIVSLALLTACSDKQEDPPAKDDSKANSSAPAGKPSEEAIEKQDEVPDEWPPEIPLPVGYEIKAASEPTQAEYHSAQVVGVPQEAVSATLKEFEANGFKQSLGDAMSERGIFNYESKKWSISLTVAPMDSKGEMTTEDTGVYTMAYLVGPVK
ncbi:hypothetical protein [Streptomyces sp. B8F3]|uniref:hypothetical protein n=1 Tax=unclassified Streptomyces TaxID=2593676 RepID=UPI00325DECAB